MATYVVGFKPPDSTWRNMKAVWDACKAAGVPAPEVVLAFFGYEQPDDQGVTVDVRALEGSGAVREWHDDSANGYEVDLSKLDPTIKTLRFYNSW